MRACARAFPLSGCASRSRGVPHGAPPAPTARSPQLKVETKVEEYLKEYQNKRKDIIKNLPQHIQKQISVPSGIPKLVQWSVGGASDAVRTPCA